MTIATQSVPGPWAGNGSTKDFSFNAPVLAAADLEVRIVTDETGASVVKTLSTDYTVAIETDFSGATISLGTAPAIGETVYITRKADKLQGTDYETSMTGSNVETGFDRLVLFIQEHAEALARALKLERFIPMGGTAHFDAGTKRIKNVVDPTDDQDAATKAYVDQVAQTSGKDGKDGADGLPGPRGPAGPAGPRGNPGPPGADGRDGTDGVDGADGENGEDGLDGWSPVFARESDGERRVLKLVKWIGGSGTEPTVHVGEYIGSDGFTATLAEAADFRGPAGAGAGDMTATGEVESGNLVEFADATGDVVKDSGKKVADLAASDHDHEIGDVTGLQTALDGKADDDHGHAISDVAGLQTALDGKADDDHGHAISDVTGLQTALDGKESADADIMKKDANHTGITGSFASASDDDGTPSSTYKPAPTGGHYKHIVCDGALEIQAPDAAGCYTLVVEVVNAAGAGDKSFSGFTTPPNIAAFTNEEGDKFLLRITKTNSTVTASVEAVQ